MEVHLCLATAEDKRKRAADIRRAYEDYNRYQREDVEREEWLNPDYLIRSGGLGGTVNYTAENYQYWRNATTLDDKGTVVYCSFQKQFGTFAGAGEGLDEYTECVVKKAIVHAKDDPWGDKTVFSQSGDGVRFGDIYVVPEEIKKGVRNEAPPGMIFSGNSVCNTSRWMPAPDYKVWIEDPRLRDGGFYCNDFVYFMTRRMLDLGFTIGNNQAVKNREFRLWATKGCIEYWCPVTKTFMSEGARRRSRHWFHNGDGSVQQRRFYSQFEMLDKYGGLDQIGIETTSSASTPKEAVSGTRRGAYSGTHRGAYSGTRRGAYSGTRRGADSGTRRGTVSGTRRGADSGTRRGAVSGTRRGTGTTGPGTGDKRKRGDDVGDVVFKRVRSATQVVREKCIRAEKEGKTISID